MESTLLGPAPRLSVCREVLDEDWIFVCLMEAISCKSKTKTVVNRSLTMVMLTRSIVTLGVTVEKAKDRVYGSINNNTQFGSSRLLNGVVIRHLVSMTD